MHTSAYIERGANTALVHTMLKVGSNKHMANHSRADHFHNEKNEHKPPNTDTDHSQHWTSNSIKQVE